MKKFKLTIIIIFMMLFTGCGILVSRYNFQIGFNKYIKGYWGNWELFYELYRPSFYGTAGNFIVYSGTGHKSDYSLKIVANNCHLSNKDNSKQWYEYTGSITYRTIEHHNDGKQSSETFINELDEDYIAYGRRHEVTRPATIKIYPQRSGYTYNIYFDGVGLGLTIPWQIAK